MSYRTQPTGTNITYNELNRYIHSHIGIDCRLFKPVCETNEVQGSFRCLEMYENARSLSWILTLLGNFLENQKLQTTTLEYDLNDSLTRLYHADAINLSSFSWIETSSFSLF